jgi:cobalt-zinc-cadmium efflux system protein
MSEHHHGHHHHHNHRDTSEGRLLMVFALNACFTVVEFVGGYLTQSTAIMADAVHDLGDTLAIASALVLNRIGHRQSDATFTYGYRRLSLFGALFNAVVLVVGCVWILTEALERFDQAILPNAQGMMWLAFLGVVVNGAAALGLRAGKTMNERVLNWHLLEDMMGWIVVLVAAIALHFVQWTWLDPALSVAFSLFILFNVLRSLKETLRLFAQATPDRELSQKIKGALTSIEQVEDVHHFHMWSLDGDKHVVSAHIKLNNSDASTHADVKHEINALLKPFNIYHTTFELELADEPCRMNPKEE